VDQERSNRNQSLVRCIRRGQQAAEHLYILETGIRKSIDVAELCLMTLSDPSGVYHISNSDANRFSKIANDTISHAKLVRGSYISKAFGNPLTAVAENGFLTSERNILSLRDYCTDISGWQESALNILLHIAAMRRGFGLVIRAATRARVALVEENKDLMYRVANDVCSRAPGRFHDILSVANCQFVLCMDETYDLASEPNVLFTTYAMKCMRMRCIGAIATPQMSVHIPHARHGLALKILAGDISLTADEIPDEDERRSEAEIRHGIYNLHNPLSIESSMSETDDRAFGEVFLPHVDGEMDRIVDEAAVAEIITKSLLTSGLHHHVVMRQRVGVFGDDHSNTFSDIANILHHVGLTDHVVSRTRVGQILEEARDIMLESLDGPDALRSY
jgi:DNA-directed RNA polymerase specialized sigma subunit